MDNVSVSLALLFIAVLFISQALLLPAAGKKAKHKELSRRLKETQRNIDAESLSLLKEHYNKELSPLDRKLIVISFLRWLEKNVGTSRYESDVKPVLTCCFSLRRNTLIDIDNDQPSMVHYCRGIHFCLGYRLSICAKSSDLPNGSI